MIRTFTLALSQLADPRVLRVIAKSMALTLLLFAVLGTAGWFAIDWLLAEAGLDETRMAAPEGLRGMIALIVILLGGWLLWRILALLVLQFFADEVVEAVEARHYPAALAMARRPGWREELAAGLKGAGRALGYNLLALPLALLLLVTGIGAALVFWLVNALLLGRELMDIVWLRHRHSPDAPNPLTGMERFMLGGVVAGLLLVPFINLLAPVVGAAMAAHLVHRKGVAVHVA